MKAIKGKYEENDRILNDQFINGINDETMTSEIDKELTSMKNTHYWGH